jgi:MFS transporter, SP family, solute carrier family 2 (facilitated glucose transporter), member 3
MLRIASEGKKINFKIILFNIFFLRRKASYLTCVVLFTIGGLCFQFCRSLSSIELLILGRIFVGLASGMTTTCLPLYLTEIAPLPLRGVLGVFVSVGVTGGVVVAQIFSLQQLLGTADLWHYCLSFQLVFVVVCSIFYWKFPESPKYLYLMNDKAAALVELKKLCDDSDMAQNELNSMESLRDSNEDNSHCGVLTVLKDPKLFLPLVLVCAMQGGQQLSGINAVSLSGDCL